MELFSIASSSSGNCIYVGSGSTRILVDAGISKKRIEQGLLSKGIEPSSICAILVTHEHADHIKGLGVMCRGYDLPVYTTESTWLAAVSQSSTGRIDSGLFHKIIPEQPFKIGTLEILPFSTYHDAADPVGYRFAENAGTPDEKKAAVVTDLGRYDDRIVEHLKDLDAVFMEANHDLKMLEVGPYPYPLKQRIAGDYGHLSNEASGQLLCRIYNRHLKHILLGHMSKENNFSLLAYETVKLEVTLSSVPVRGEDLEIVVAEREEPSEMITI